MPYLYVRHKVKDFDAWHKVFASNAKDQEESGLIDCQLLRTVDDPNDVAMLFRVTDLMKAREFTNAPEADQARDQSGVIGEPTVLWLDEL